MILLLLLFPSFLMASDSYQDARTYAQGLALPSVTQGNPHDIPQYRGEGVPETDYLENPQNMGGRANEMLNGGGTEVGNTLHEGQRTRQEYDVRFGAEHPLLREGDRIVSDPHAILNIGREEGTPGVAEVVETEHTCEEAGEPETLECDRVLNFQQRFFQNRRYVNTTIQGNIFRRYSVGGNPQYTNPHTRNMGHDQHYNLRIVNENMPAVNWRYHDGCNWYGHSVSKNYQTFEDFELIDQWEDNCPAMEEYADQHNCSYGERVCVEGPETRMIHGRSVFRECWRERRTYRCQVESLNDCAPLRARGCDQRHVECKRRDRVGNCIEYRKTFVCQAQRLSNGMTRLSGEVPYCLDGNCDEHVWDANRDFAQVMSKLSVFREMAKDMEASETTATAFKGTCMRCSKATLSFQDCCGSGGWGTSLGLATACSEEEKHLAKERGVNKCVYVGTHCAERDSVTRLCLKKKSTYCCFGTKLSRILHEQGRLQLGIGWGDSENPECRPFTLEELQRIDFSRIDLSELFQEIQSRTKANNVSSAAQRLIQNWSDKVQSLKREPAPHPDPLTPLPEEEERERANPVVTAQQVPSPAVAAPEPSSVEPITTVSTPVSVPQVRTVPATPTTRGAPVTPATPVNQQSGPTPTPVASQRPQAPITPPALTMDEWTRLVHSPTGYLDVRGHRIYLLIENRTGSRVQMLPGGTFNDRITSEVRDPHPEGGTRCSYMLGTGMLMQTRIVPLAELNGGRR